MTLYVARLVSLALTFALGAVSGSVGVNATISSSRSKKRLQGLAPAKTLVNIDTTEIQRPGTSATVASFVICGLAFIFIILSIRSKSTSARSLRIQAISLGVAAAWLFGSAIAYILVFVDKGAVISASMGGVELPAAIVQGFVVKTGVSPAYKTISYLKTLAACPWAALLSTLVSIVILFFASTRTTTTPDSAVEVVPVMSEKDTGSIREDNSMDFAKKQSA